MAERITGHTELIGLMAYPIRHSSSPAMQNEAFAKLGYDYAYLAFEVGADEIEDAVKAIRTLKMRGSNVSMPNKTLVGQYLDAVSYTHLDVYKRQVSADSVLTFCICFSVRQPPVFLCGLPIGTQSQTAHL